MWNTGVIFYLGVWMVLTPILLPNARAHIINYSAVGALVLVLSVASGRVFRWETFVAGATGIYLFACAFVPALRLGDRFIWTNVTLGIVLMATGGLATAERRSRATSAIGDDRG